MYIVSIYNGEEKIDIHGDKDKLLSGNIVEGINTIDSFSFSIHPANRGFNRLCEFKTLVQVYNTNKARYEFQGRVLTSDYSMDESGKIKNEATCESIFGYLCDSRQKYVAKKRWIVRDFLNHIIGIHNGQVETEKRFVIRTVDFTNTIECEIARENTWDTIKKNLLDVIGGELQFEVVEGIIHLDYLERIGETKTTSIEISKNMKSITREKDPSAFITRLIPLGAKIDSESEERLEITTINGGKNYIDDAEAIEKYGIHVGYAEFDEETNKANLKAKGERWLKQNNKVQTKYSVTALDLSLLGLDMDDFTVGNWYPIKNHLLVIDVTARIIKKNIDVCEEIKSTFEIGDSFKTFNELQKEYIRELSTTTHAVSQLAAKSATKSDLVQINTALNGKASTSYVDEKFDSVPSGKSAYEIWLEEGNIGTEEDFLNSLKGADGANGKDGRGIQKIEINADGNFVVTYTDGTKQTITVSSGGDDGGDDNGGGNTGGGGSESGNAEGATITNGVISGGNVTVTEITILPETNGEEVESVANRGFYNNDYIQKVTINVPTIGDSAFANCNSLESVTLGTNVTSIGSNVFNGCTSLTKIYYEGTEEEFAQISKAEDWLGNRAAYVTIEYLGATEPDEPI